MRPALKLSIRLLPCTRWQWTRCIVLGTVVAAIVFLFFVWPLVGLRNYQPQIGDIVFQPLTRLSDLVRTIEGVTHSPYSHCGVVVKRDGQWYVIEALGEVRLTPLARWVRQGRLSRFAVYRLDEEHRESIPAFVQELEKYVGLPYDTRFRMDDASIYCSELVYKGFRDATDEELGQLVPLRDLDWEPYAHTIEKYEGGPAALERMIITPRHLSEASQLERVFGFYL